jgi:hypothetical protein
VAGRVEEREARELERNDLEQREPRVDVPEDAGGLADLGVHAPRLRARGLDAEEAAPPDTQAGEDGDEEDDDAQPAEPVGQGRQRWRAAGSPSMSLSTVAPVVVSPLIASKTDATGDRRRARAGERTGSRGKGHPGEHRGGEPREHDQQQRLAPVQEIARAAAHEPAGEAREARDARGREERERRGRLSGAAETRLDPAPRGDDGHRAAQHGDEQGELFGDESDVHSGASGA